MVAALSHEGLGDQGQATDNGSAGKLLVIPFKDMYQVYGTETSYRCPFTGKVHMLGYVTPSADDLLTDHLMLLLKNLGGYQVMLADRASGLVAEQVAGQKRLSSELDFLIAIGRDYGAERILANYLYRFKERVGGNYAAESPASVAFSLFLIDVPSGQLIWARHLDETQKALSENLFELRSFIKRKGRWVTAEQMALSGLEKMVSELPQPGPTP
jgi:hypothetical protein